MCDVGKGGGRLVLEATIEVAEMGFGWIHAIAPAGYRVTAGYFALAEGSPDVVSVVSVMPSMANGADYHNAMDCRVNASDETGSVFYRVFIEPADGSDLPILGV